MKIVFDKTVIESEHRFRGIGSYARNLMTTLKTIDRKNKYLWSRQPYLEEVDIVHFPYFDFFFPTLPFIKPIKTVVTIHDLIPLVFPFYYLSGIKGKINFWRQWLSLRNVKAVIADSENSKKDIVRFLHISAAKIFVVYLAPGEKFRIMEPGKSLEGLRKRYRLPQIFVLYVGDVNYNKNLLGLLRGFKEARAKVNNLGLVLVGRAFENKNLKEVAEIDRLIEKLGIGGEVRKLGYIPEEELVGIYNLASVYCQPSFYEGFGLPPLEAMACGTPVVAGNRPGLKEVCQKVAVMVDPERPEDIARGIWLAISDQELREKLVSDGLKRVDDFSWEKAGRETLAVYEKVFFQK